MLTPRERVELTINLKEPDRVPIYVNTITDKAYVRLCKHLGLESVEVRHGLISHDAILSEKFLEILNVDFRSIGINVDVGRESMGGWRIKYLPGGLVEDWYGVKWKDTGHMFYPVYHPLQYAKTVEDIENYPRWPNPDDPNIIEGKYKMAKKLYEETDYALVCSAAEMLFHRYAFLRGFKQWFLDMKLNPELYKALADKILEIGLRATLNLLNEVGDYVVWIWIADDMGTQTRPFMSTSEYRKFVKPWFEKYVKSIKKEFPKIKVCYHCHGAVYPLIPEFIDCGIDILNPILPKEKGNDPEKLKRDFGGRLCFHGGIDIQETIPFGTTRDVEEHVKQVIRILAPGGGYIFCLQNIRENAPPENVMTAFKAALKYGKYPIENLP